MRKGAIYKDKRTQVCYVCLEDGNYKYLSDLDGNTIRGRIDESDFIEATDADILAYAKDCYQYFLKELEE